MHNTLYLLDRNNVFSGVFTIIDFKSPVPNGVFEVPPDLTGSQVAKWNGVDWEVLPEYPQTVVVTQVPPAVTMRQARLALLSVGLLDDVDTAINSLPSPQKEAARIEWEYSQEVQRHNGFVSVLAPTLGLTEESLDNLFIEAAKL